MRFWPLFLFPALAFADPLEAFLKDLHTLEAAFVQVVTDEGGEVLERSEGKVWLKRPGRFRWEYQRPYRQLILADGRRLWIYDPDLEQVTVKPLSALGETPASLLASEEPLEGFDVEVEGSWVLLRPRSREMGFETLRLGFEGGELRAMVLRDALGHVTRIALRDVRRNPPLDDALFTFTPPPGADVIDETR